MEAMSIGCLIIGSRTAPVEELIQHEKNGLLVDFFDPTQLANTVCDALSERKELVHLRQNARQHIVEQYDLMQHCLPAQLQLAYTTASADTHPH
jgi:glycosyltransferase involved in cell wall biosynthesis